MTSGAFAEAYAPAYDVASTSAVSWERQAIVDALATVEGVSPHYTNPDAPVAGDAWPVWVIANFSGKLCRVVVNDFDVLAILPASYAPTTVESGDGLMPLLATALSKVGTVQTAEPVAIQVADSSTMPGLRVRVTPRKVYTP